MLDTSCSITGNAVVYYYYFNLFSHFLVLISYNFINFFVSFCFVVVVVAYFL